MTSAEAEAIREFFGVPFRKWCPLKRATTRRVYEEKRLATHQLQGQNGTTFGGDLASADNSLGVIGESYDRN